MITDTQSRTIADLDAAFKCGSLRVNPEYQRGADGWKQPQKQALIDSIFRGYPVPPLFIHRRTSKDPLSGHTATSSEVIDGQQRLRALNGYIAGDFALLHVDDPKLRMPVSLRQSEAGWAGCTFAELSIEMRARLLDTPLRVHFIEEATDDEIRDVFIRLQAGTALSRQQVRDAWPGEIGPLVIALAGKQSRLPTTSLFAMIDGRGERSDDDDGDPYVKDRQVCAQLLNLFIARSADAFACPSVGANELDALYHSELAFTGHTEFKETLRHITRVLQALKDLRCEGRASLKKVFRKTEVFALLLYFVDLRRNPNHKVTASGLEQLARHINAFSRIGEPSGKRTSGRFISEYYAWWRGQLGDVAPGPVLDSQRAFSAKQKEEISARDNGLCQVCGDPVAPDEAEYDHHPIPHREGGVTAIGNGRLVHRKCHARGRPRAA